MKAQEFCYWLQGFFELQNPQSLDLKQTELIKRHLKMVFIHEPIANPFCNFLNGFFTIENPQFIAEEKTLIIKNELDKVFTHVVKKEVKNTQVDKNTSKLEALC